MQTLLGNRRVNEFNDDRKVPKAKVAGQGGLGDVKG
jgi:hypothetical protein